MGDCNFTYKNGTRTLRKSASNRINNNENNAKSEKIILSEIDKRIDPKDSKLNKTFQSLPAQFRYNIIGNLLLSKEIKSEMQEYIDKGKSVPINDEWATGLNNSREKMKVITEYENGKLTYTVKQKNKIILKKGTKIDAANKIAIFYDKQIKKMEKQKK